MKKSKKLLIGFIAVFTLLICFTFGASAETENNFEYSVSDGGAIVTGYEGDGRDIIIPDTLGGYPVTSIGASAFSNWSGLRSITIPESVVSIGENAFYYCSSLESITIPYGVTSIEEDTFSGCTSLKSVTIPESVTSIGHWAFWNCNQLESITIPNSVTSIGAIAFSNCKSLTSITIPRNVTSIGRIAFSNCTNLTSITVDENNEYFSSQDGILFNKDKTELIRFPIANEITTYIMPNSVLKLSDGAFEYCDGLESISFSESLTAIGGETFASCDNLKKVKLPQSVTNISYYAFAKCKALADITVDENNERYSSEDGVLFNKKKTELIQYPANNAREIYALPETVTEIGALAFASNKNLKLVIIPDSVKTIRNCAFEESVNLTSVSIGDGVTWIGEAAFWECKNLKSIIIPDGVTSIVKSTFWGCTSLESVTIGKGVTTIEDSAFCGCISLKSITIPDNVTNIGSWAFDDCSGLERAIIGDGVTNIGYSAFADNRITVTHYCGAQEQWDAITIDGQNYGITNTVHMETDKNADGICDFCNYIMYHVHSYVEYVKEATCTENGAVKNICSCGYSYVVEIPATGHSYGNDNICDNCGYDRSQECSCNCHKGGLSGLFYRILRFFWKLFKTNSVCHCGAAHY